MSLIILGIVVLCSLLFVVYTLVGYFETASPLRQALPDLKVATEAKRTRLDEYHQRIENLRESIPRDEVRLTRMEKWVTLLTEQNDRLKALEIERQRAELEKQIAVDREKGGG